MISIKERIAYTEVLTILEELNLMSKVPNKLIEFMKREKDTSFTFNFNKEMLSKSQLLTKNGAELLSVIYLTYICNNLNEKNKLKNIYEENEKKYAPKNSLLEVFEKEEKNEEDNKNKEAKGKDNILPLKEKELTNKLKRIINKILKIFK